MKKLMLSCLLAVFFLSATSAQRSQERTGYEGDFFSLEGAIDLFKQSHSINDFERKLNTKDNWVNNLDLNYNGRTDYVRVEHRHQGDYHAIILQIPISRREVQDVAVIEIEKTGRRDAVLQIVGNADLYGEEVIVEPLETYGYSNGRGGPSADYEFYNDYVNVYYWPAVQYIFDRQYRTYVSPYRWDYYPRWWSPWNQCTWSIFRPRIVVYHRHYHRTRIHRVVHVHHFYEPYRASCSSVVYRTNELRVKQGRKPLVRQTRQTTPLVRDYQRGNKNTTPTTATRVKPSGSSYPNGSTRSSSKDIYSKKSSKGNTYSSNSKEGKGSKYPTSTNNRSSSNSYSKPSSSRSSSSSYSKKPSSSRSSSSSYSKKPSSSRSSSSSYSKKPSSSRSSSSSYSKKPSSSRSSSSSYSKKPSSRRSSSSSYSKKPSSSRSSSSSYSKKPSSSRSSSSSRSTKRSSSKKSSSSKRGGK